MFSRYHRRRLSFKGLGFCVNFLKFNITITGIAAKITPACKFSCQA